MITSITEDDLALVRRDTTRFDDHVGTHRFLNDRGDGRVAMGRRPPYGSTTAPACSAPSCCRTADMTERLEAHPLPGDLQRSLMLSEWLDQARRSSHSDNINEIRALRRRWGQGVRFDIRHTLNLAYVRLMGPSGR
ncbi:hypothetical protein [Planomonospora sp. ID82291]|uniref:hypothetical protein n=1 Tax=Planomonospora sp. ID82291 TaxID=2738136 RepID=UPI0018C45001|nr:hypothetical protein [Planomonospora sp. ID82291]MBG0815289.1 hypothetical protein [Planomonospora sp. ID82291]